MIFPTIRKLDTNIWSVGDYHLLQRSPQLDHSIWDLYTIQDNYRVLSTDSLKVVAEFFQPKDIKKYRLPEFL